MSSNKKLPNWVSCALKWLNAPIIVALIVLMIETCAIKKENQDYYLRIQKLEGNITLINNSIQQLNDNRAIVYPGSGKGMINTQAGEGNTQNNSYSDAEKPCECQ